MRLALDTSTPVGSVAIGKAGEVLAHSLLRVRATTGIDLEIISGREEANLALAGCAPLLDRRKRHALIFDVGGGSTQPGDKAV